MNKEIKTSTDEFIKLSRLLWDTIKTDSDINFNIYKSISANIERNKGKYSEFIVRDNSGITGQIKRGMNIQKYNDIILSFENEISAIDKQIIENELAANELFKSISLLMTLGKKFNKAVLDTFNSFYFKKIIFFDTDSIKLYMDDITSGKTKFPTELLASYKKIVMDYKVDYLKIEKDARDGLMLLLVKNKELEFRKVAYLEEIKKIKSRKRKKINNTKVNNKIEEVSNF